MPDHLIALDAGTTGIKAFVFHADGTVVGGAGRELSMQYPKPGWVEQRPEEIAERAREVIAAAIADAGLTAADIAALGITNQRASVVAWDAETGAPLSPMLIWQDVRTAARCVELQSQGLYITPMMGASKAEWIVRNIPEAAEAARAGRLRLGTPNSWLAAALCGPDVHASDHGNASATGIYSYFDLRWDPAPLQALGLDPAWLPRLVDSAGELARTRADLAGIEVPLAGMAGDQQASLFGCGCLAPGQTKCSYGTSAMVTANSGISIGLGGMGTYPIIAWRIGEEAVYSLEGNVVTAGAAVQWLRDALALVTDASETADIAASVPDSGGVWAVPSFQGLGTPVMNDGARALLGGLSRATTRAHIVRAVLEGIAQRVTDVADSVWENSGRPDVLRVDGGASRNDVLMQMQADFLGLPVERSRLVECGAAGAARLAGLGAGLYSGTDELAALWSVERRFEPTLDAGRREESRAAWKRRVELTIQAAS